MPSPDRDGPPRDPAGLSDAEPDAAAGTPDAGRDPGGAGAGRVPEGLLPAPDPAAMRTGQDLERRFVRAVASARASLVRAEQAGGAGQAALRAEWVADARFRLAEVRRDWEAFLATLRLEPPNDPVRVATHYLPEAAACAREAGELLEQIGRLR